MKRTKDLVGTSDEAASSVNFVDALEEYTKRIESTVVEIETYSENTLTRMFALLIFLLLISASVPLAARLVEDFQGSLAYRSFLQTAFIFSFVSILALTMFTIYIRLLKLRRHRRNLATLLWPYQKLVQKLNQLVDHGRLDDDLSTLVQLKVLEAEVAYGRARRLVSSRVPFALFFGLDFEPSSKHKY